MKELILASTSPRRKEILSLAGYEFKVASPTSLEEFDEKISVAQNIERIAFDKALSVFKENKESVVIGVDTVVELDTKIFTKPQNKEDAKAMLKTFSGKSHFVTSGLAILSKEKSITKHISTQVVFKELEDSEIEYYINTDEPWDKAGGYAIQGKASVFVKGLQGCYYNVMGLPLNLMYEILRKDFGINPK